MQGYRVFEVFGQGSISDGFGPQGVLGGSWVVIDKVVISALKGVASTVTIVLPYV